LPAPKPGLHPRNKSLSGYDFPALTAIAPGLVKYVVNTANGTPSIDFSNPGAIKALNRALLALHYGVRGWEIPAG
jgi:23S rRNA (adenine1618-N6)-methyltransferase